MPFANALFRNYFSSAFTRTNSNKISKFSMEIGKNSDIKIRMTAGIIVIGDEILKGSTVDSNSHFLCQHLYNRGVLVKKISVIGDHVGEIAKEVRQFSGAFDIVFTTGGIGPTHDDRTFEGLAAAFGEQLATSEELLKIAQIFMRKTNLKNIDDSVEKFCRLPESATLLWGSQKPPVNPSELVAFPSVRIRNVIALPGVPQFCEQSFELLEDHLFPSAKMASFFSKNIYLRKNELHLQQKLAQIAEKYAPDGVTIGSYPVVGHSYFKTRLSIDSEDIGMGKSAFEELQREFSEWIAEFDERPWENCAEKLEKFRQNQPQEFADKIDEAMKTINEILEKYSLDQIALSFNGGKDCTLLLHLFRAAIDSKYGKETQIRGFFIEGDDEFEEVVEFVRNISKSYNLSMWELKGGQKAGLAQLKKEQSKIVAVLMGSRSTDPMGKFMKTKVEWTDADWPTFLRVCPLLDWRYSQIWLGLRGLCIPYCPLYDQGYSSLGERSKTAKNPHLKLEGSGDRYQPAYLLKEENLERAFREERPEGE